MVKLTRFWFEFNPPEVSSLGLQIGCGVTAWTYDDAVNILQTTIFKDQATPVIKKVIKDIDISTLEANHIRPNLLPSNVRGIWFPMGYS